MKGRPTQPFAAVRRHSARLVAGLPFDLVAVVCFAAVATALVSVLEVSSSLVRAAVGTPLLCFAPGYVIVSMLFPRATPVAQRSGDSGMWIGQVRDLSDVERVALSVGTSFVFLPLLGILIAHSQWAFTAPVVVTAVTAFVAVGAVIAAVRRLLVPATERYRVGFRRRFAAVRTAIFGGESTRRVAVNVALVCSMLLALTVIGYAFVAPQQGETYTDLQLLTENESGDLVASGYPEEVDPREVYPLVVALENQEGEPVNYTVVVQEQRLEDGEVVERTELERYRTEIDPGGNDTEDLTLRPTDDPGDVRLSVMVFVDDVPETPTHDDAYRYGHVWTTVTGEGDAAADTDLEADDDDADGGDESGANETDETDDDADDGDADDGDGTDTDTDADDGDGTDTDTDTDADDTTESDEADDDGPDDDDVFDFEDDEDESDGDDEETDADADADTDEDEGDEDDGAEDVDDDDADDDAESDEGDDTDDDNGDTDEDDGDTDDE